MKNTRTKNIISLILNILNALLVTVAVGWFFTGKGLELGAGNMGDGGIRCLRYFTVLSNILVAFCSIIIIPFNISVIRNKENKIPAWALIFKFIGTTAVTVTFITVIVFLAPQIGYGKMFADNCLELHLICPLLAIISFIFFEHGILISKTQALLGVIPIFLYANVYLTNVIFTKKWHDFYGFNIGGYWYISYVVMMIATYALALAIMVLHNKLEKQKDNRSCEVNP